MKKILITRKLLKENEERISKIWDAKLNKSDRDIEENHKNVKRGDEIQDKSGLRNKLKSALKHLILAN